MGLCSSCCRRRKSPETDPLLPKHTSGPSETSPVVKLADILGAFNAGKLPSTDQASILLQHALRSDFLRDSEDVPLVPEVRDLIQAGLRLSLEKNYDDKLQNLIFQSSRSSETQLDAQLVVDSQPIEDASSDLTSFLQSLMTLTQLTLTSSAFRMLISDILGTTREIVAEAASEIGEVAAEVQATAFEVAKTVETGAVTADTLEGKARESYAGLQQSVENAHSNMGTLGDNSADRVRDLVVGRVQEIVLHAQKNPEHRSALRTILVLFRKYSTKVDLTEQPAMINAQITVSPPLDEALTDFKLLLERLASGRSLDPLLLAFKAAINDVLDAPSDVSAEIHDYFASLGQWFDRALSEPQFAASRLGTKTAGDLYDAGRLLLASEAHAQWANSIRLLVTEASAFTTALASDSVTHKFVQALQALLSALRKLISTSTHKLRNALLKKLLTWAIPKIFKSIKMLPVPRIEFSNKLVDVVIDALEVTPATTSTSITPDHISVQNWNELKITMSAATDGGPPSPEMSTRTRIHVDGMQVGAHGFGYYVKYKGTPTLLHYSDQGLLDVDIGAPGTVGEGLTVDVDLSTSDAPEPGEPRIQLNDVSVGVPGLVFGIRESKHWLLNRLLVQPFSGPLVRLVLKIVLEQQIRRLVGWADRMFFAVGEEAGRIHSSGLLSSSEESPSVEDYWAAALRTLPAFLEHDYSAPAVETETHIEPTLTGIIHTTTTVGDPEDMTVLAVGVGSQVVPHQAGAYGVDEGATSGDEGLEEAARVRADIEQAEERRVQREQFERHRDGWRSGAFNLN
ncbi:hypothetical protein FB45DRAFT_829411 [Roridomyces roridus]|uniref:HAM1-like N-terminal domain-containing protein n=1 Tax=Roridomyces roridus TaxID=1738132 RepID=A0AAD7C2H2_9AGAR|nr:hypothetical protein FB45DRAFT_829411 [Roridomyces roridus]